MPKFNTGARTATEKLYKHYTGWSVVATFAIEA